MNLKCGCKSKSEKQEKMKRRRRRRKRKTMGDIKMRESCVSVRTCLRELLTELRFTEISKLERKLTWRVGDKTYGKSKK